MKSVKWFVDRNLVYGEDQIAKFINKNKSEYLILKVAFNDDLRVETIQQIYFDLNKGLIKVKIDPESSVQRQKCIDFARKSRVLFGSIAALERIWYPAPSPVSKLFPTRPLVLIQDESSDEIFGDGSGI